MSNLANGRVIDRSTILVQKVFVHGIVTSF